jgi:hypothetical protein
MNLFKFPLLIVMIALLINACATTTNVPQSKKITQNTSVTQNDWKYVSSYNFEQKIPGLGYSEKYFASFGWADVYEYDLGKQNWRDGVSDPQFNEHFQQVVGEVHLQERTGYYQDVKVSHVKDEILNDVTLRHAVLQYKLEGKNVESHIYLSGVQGFLLKFRITVYLPIKSEERESMVRFVQKMIDKTLKKKRNKFPNRVINPNPKPKKLNPEITL